MRTDLQTQFNKYHEKIKLKDTDDNKPLRDKREVLLNELRDFLKKKSEDEDAPKITFTAKNQGSYSMGTGVKPLDGSDYDIDVMLLFNISKNDYENPVEVKQWVYDALNKSPRTVEIKRPCVRVQYREAGEDAYHVDFAIYSNEDSNDDGKTYLAKGYPGSSVDKKVWEVANPERLKEIVDSKYTDVDKQQQFKRTIRYMKRWKDIHFSSNGNSAPTGIAITALALKLFKPSIMVDLFSSKKTINDFEALTNFVNAIINHFNGNNISIELPVEPYNDLFEKMSDNQKKTFKKKLITFKDKLVEANNEPDIVEACPIIRTQLGDDFECPNKEESAEKKDKAFTTSVESANAKR